MAETTAYVTGGTGFIGRYLLRHLLESGWRVRALVLESERTRLPKHELLEAIVGDITDAESLRGTIEGSDAVFHVAALVDSWIRHPEDYGRVNVKGTEHVIDEALRAGVPKFLFTSSMSGIGVTPGARMREDSPPGRVFGPYEQSKADAERLVAAAAHERGLPAITLIPSIVIGPGDLRNTGKFLLSYVRGEFPGTFTEASVLPVVGVEDVARAHVLAFRNGRVGERYIISSENVAWGDLLRMASDTSGTPAPTRHIGNRALWFASRSGELLARVRRSPPRLPAWLADFLMTGATMDNSKSIRELGIAYSPIRESIESTVAWFQEEGLFTPAAAAASPLRHLPVENPRVDAEGAFESDVPGSQAPPDAPGRRPKPPEGPS